MCNLVMILLLVGLAAPAAAVTSDPDTGKAVVDLEGDLAGILCLGQTSKNAASVSEDGVSQLKLVAGARNHLNLLFDAPHI